MMTNMLRAAVVGCGYWGPNLIRNFVELPDVSLEAVVDLDWNRLTHIQKRYPGIPLVTDDITQIFDAGLDAVVVSTPPETHHDVVRSCLEQGLDVLVEKPLATSSVDARALVSLAERYDRVLMVGHTFLYNPAVHALKQMIDDGGLGDVWYVDAVRVGLGLFHPSLNVVWDLAPHDISILMHILGQTPTWVTAKGIACVQESIEDVAYITLTFPNGVLAHVRVSWLDPKKTRRITVVGSKQMCVYDDVDSQEKLRVYDKRVDAIRRTDTYGEFQFAYHYGSIVTPYVHFDEPLKLECAHFVECVRDGREPVSNGRNGAEVVDVIEAAQQSLALGGVPVAVGQGPDPAAVRSAAARRAVTDPFSEVDSRASEESLPA